MPPGTILCRGRDGPAARHQPDRAIPRFATIIKAAGACGSRPTRITTAPARGIARISGDDCRRPPHEQTSRCYLDPIPPRNVQIETEALTRQGWCSTGALHRLPPSFAARCVEALAACAVVVRIGAFNSPQLLELSGIASPKPAHSRIEVAMLAWRRREFAANQLRGRAPAGFRKRASPSTISGAASPWPRAAGATRCSGRAGWR